MLGISDNYRLFHIESAMQFPISSAGAKSWLSGHAAHG
ncbi:hypothetical protein L282_2507 [Escherichia coli APEC IMT5155]|nr:hypothetical protein L282_2507 [Escherichia coli APEC IMT5155]QAZ70542.1 hypothetical protein FORC82_0851 [Escherichia coli]